MSSLVSKVIICLLLAVSVAASPDTIVSELEPTSGTWRVYRGIGYATLVCSARSEQGVKDCAAADAERRTSTTRYQLRYPNRYLTVAYSAPRVVTLSWTPPTTSTDGSALSDLAGYRIHYGPSPTMLTQTIQLANPGVNRHVIEGLQPGIYYFAVRAYTATGESALSNIAQKTVQ